MDDYSLQINELMAILDPGMGNPERQGPSKSLYWDKNFAEMIVKDLSDTGIEAKFRKESKNPFKIQVKLYCPSDYRDAKFLSQDDLLLWSKTKMRGFKTMLWGPDNYVEPTIVEVWEELKLYHAVKLAYKNGSKLANSAPCILEYRGAILGKTIGITE